MEDKQDIYERMDEENTKSNITDLIVFSSKFGEKSFEDLRELYYYDQNKYEDRKSYTNKKGLKFSIKDTCYKCNRTLNDSEILEFVKYITEKADDGDQFYCLMAGEIFIYSDDMHSIFGSYLIGPRLYDREKAIKRLLTLEAE